MNISAAYRNVRDIARKVTDYGVTLPASVTDALKELDRVESLKPPVYSIETLSHVFLDPKARPADIDRHAANVAAERVLSQAWGAAQTKAGENAQAAFSRAADEILTALRPIAEESIREVEWYASEGAPTVMKLVQENRPDDATRASRIEEHFTRLLALTTLRDRLFGRGFSFKTVGLWSNPLGMEKIPPTITDYPARLIAGYNAGGRMTWATVAEGVELVEAVEAEARRLRREEAEQRNNAHRAARSRVAFA